MKKLLDSRPVAAGSRLLARPRLAASDRRWRMAASASAVSKQAVLDNIATSVLLPALQRSSPRGARDFAAAADALTGAERGDARSARSRHGGTCCSRGGARSRSRTARSPTSASTARIQFWPSRRQSVDGCSRAQRPIDDTYVAGTGRERGRPVGARDLLFDTAADAARLAAFARPGGDRQRTYFQALRARAAGQTRLVEHAWEGPQRIRGSVACGGQASAQPAA